MYDFLVYRSIDLLQQLYWGQQYFKQTKLTNNQLLAPIEDFLQVRINASSYDINPNIVQLYQQLLRTQIAAKRTDALIISDLDRLTFINQNANIANKDSLYLNTLERLNRKYHDYPYSVEILNVIAQYYYTHEKTLEVIKRNYYPITKRFSKYVMTGFNVSQNTSE